MNRIAIVATAIVLVRLVVAIFHDHAHEALGVGLSSWQWTYVYTVIIAAPLLAMILYWTRYARTAAMLLGVSMLAGMLFGVYFHFVFVSPDNVAHLPEGHGQHSFIATAILLVPIEIAGTAYGFWSWNKLRAAPESVGDVSGSTAP